MLKIYRKLSDTRNMYLIKNSGYFDKEYYKKEYPEVKGSALKHYYYYGYKEGKNPCDKFFNDDYLKNNVDVLNAGINPLLHYLVSGKKEGREVKGYLGVSIDELYEKLYHHKYAYKIYMKNNISQINLFLTSGIKDYKPLLKFILDYCVNQKIGLRIIYQSVDLNELNLFFEEEQRRHNYFLDITFLKLNSHYNLEVGPDDYYICTDLFSLSALINTVDIANTIYYYLVDEDKLTEVEKILLSFFSDNQYIKCFSNHNIHLPKYQLRAVTNTSQKIDMVTNFCFDIDDVFGLQMLSDYFMEKAEVEKINLSYMSQIFHKKICLENLKKIDYVTKPKNNDFVIQVGFLKKQLLPNHPCLSVYFDKKDEEYIPCFNLKNEIRLELKKYRKDYTSIFINIISEVETEM